MAMLIKIAIVWGTQAYKLGSKGVNNRHIIMEINLR